MKKVIQFSLIIMLICQQAYSQNLYVFMKVDGINGSYTFPGNIPDGNNSIELKNFQFTETNSLKIGSASSGVGIGKAEAPVFEFVVDPTDKAIVGLYQKMMTSSEVADTVKIYVYAESGGDYFPIELIKLKKPRVVEIRASGISGNNSGLATAVKLRYHAIHKTGYNYESGSFIPDGSPSIMLWNYATNKKEF